MTATMKIELLDSYIVLPTLHQDQSPTSGSSTPVPGSPASSTMDMTSPARTFSFGAASIAPSSVASVRSSLDLDADAQPLFVSSSPSSVSMTSSTITSSSSSSGTTELKGTVVVTFTKPTKVASLAISLNGSTHVGFLGVGKRSHYSRHHIRAQQFLIEPIRSTSTTSVDGYTLVQQQTVSYPFSIQIPNHLPVSVTTPQGGTIYRLTAVLTLAKTAGIMSFLSSGSTFTTMATVQIYRAGLVRSPLLESTDPRSPSSSPSTEPDEDEDEENQETAMTPDAVTHIWPGQLEATVSIPYVQLPPKSRPDLHLRIRVLRDTIAIKSFQAALWERAIFRVQKAGADPATGKMHVIATRDRIISAQRCDAGWVNEAITSQVPHTFEKVVLFAIPSSIRTNSEMYSSRTGNSSSRYRLAKDLARRTTAGGILPMEEDQDIKDSEFGEIHIEIQHFIRYSIFVTGAVDSKGKTVPTMTERLLGDMGVLLRGLPRGPEVDNTGLPTYLGSFSTSRVSYEEAHDYEFEASGASLVNSNGEDSGEGRGSNDGSSSLGPIYGDYENDDAFMALMGFRGSRTPPSYEDTVSGRPSLDASISELQGLQISLPLYSSESSSGSVLGLTR